MDLPILAVTCAINLLLGLVVLTRDIRRVYTQLFFLMSVLLCAWIITNYITNHSVDNLALASIANHLTFISGYGVLLSAVIFTHFFPARRKAPLYEVGAVTSTAIIMFGLAMTESVAGVVGVEDGVLVFSVGPLLWVYVVGFVLTVMLMVKNILYNSKAGNELEKRQSHFVIFAFATTAIAGLSLNVIIPLIWGNWELTRYGPLSTIILVATIAYTIIRHRLFDIRLAVVRAITYALSLATLASVYYLMVYLASRTFLSSDVTRIDLSPLSILLVLLLASIFQPVKHFFDRLTNRIFYRDHYDMGDFFARLSRQLSLSNDLQALLQGAVSEISDTLKAEHGSFFIRYGNRHMTVSTDQHERMSAKDMSLLDRLIAPHGQSPILTRSLDGEDKLRRLLVEQDAAITLPLFKGETLLGYLFLGAQRGRKYTSRDIRALETISDELIIGIQNALSVQEVREINSTLEQRIEEATKELRASNTLLQRLDEAKDEFVSMASHQLRTPLTSVKGYISMVLEGDAGKISDMQRQLLSEAFASSERMVHLISDFLNVSRLQTGKFMLEKRSADLSRLVTQEVDSLQTTASAHNLKLKYRAPSHFPVLYLDESKIRQVLMNFMDNAIYYSQEGTDIVITLVVEEGFAVLKVHDTGIGVPKSEQAHLFTKFFRATNARKQRPDGTGVGLFLAKKVIVAHGGTIVFESVEDAGSTFGFRLPIKKLSAAPNKHADKLNK